ncbi:MAG: hypothetical protein HY360_10250 [Verrucomicrobia bacterium]|nr:hypothetical protein [Verrucomicrobiota bacterium]
MSKITLNKVRMALMGLIASMHGLFELAGIAGRWRRPPYHSLTDPEMTRLKAFVKRMKLAMP